MVFNTNVWIERGRRGTVNLEKQIRYWEHRLKFYKKMAETYPDNSYWKTRTNEYLEKIMNLSNYCIWNCPLLKHMYGFWQCPLCNSYSYEPERHIREKHPIREELIREYIEKGYTHDCTTSNDANNGFTTN